MVTTEAEVDIFEAGPILSSPTNQIRTIKNRRYKIASSTAVKISGDEYIISTCGDEFIACIANVDMCGGDKIKITKDVFKALNLKRNDKVLISKLRG